MKSSRKSHRKSHRKNQRKSQKKQKQQRGGSSCAMMPLNTPALAVKQVGGMATITAGDQYLLDSATRVQAEVGPLDKAMAELPSVIPKQAGGKRRRTGYKSRKTGRKSHRKGRKSRKQRGGAELAPFGSSELLLPKAEYALDGTNPQFRSEPSVNPMYKAFP